MEDATFAVQLLFAFGGGIISFLSPCVLPLLPGYLGLMSGYSVAELRSGEASAARMLRVTSLFVLGFTVVFVASGAFATRLGQFLNQNQSVTTRIAGAVIIGFGILVVGMAFTNRGIFGYLAQERRLEVRPSRLGGWAPPVMGAAFGFGWTPCIGAILGVILTTAATRETVLQGMALLFSFSLGLGVPFILSGLGVGRALRAVGAFRRYLRPINVGSGLVLIAFGLVMVAGQLGRISSFFTNLLLNIPFLADLATV